MPEPAARLYLISPLLAEVDRFAPQLRAACAAGDVAAVLLRLDRGDDRTLVNHVKALAPAAQDSGTAVIVAAEGDVDVAAIAVRGGADGVHIGSDAGEVRRLRERLKNERIVGAGDVRSKHDAMSMGEAGVDYVLFGEPRADGSLPPLEAVIERAAWWAEIFETPCVAYAPQLEAVSQLVATGAEFVALGDAVWTHAQGPAAAVAAVLERCGTEAAR
jgi:thiamine-phosphate pyrophosphorylase